MPFTITARPLQQRLTVQPRVTGGYVSARQPDPNDPLETYDRNQRMLKNQTSRGPLLPQQTSGDQLGAALMHRGMEMRRASDFQNSQDSIGRGVGVINTVLPDARWEGLKQALFEASVGRLRTGARAGWDMPGFFDTQTPMMSRALNTMSPRELALLQEMSRQSAASPYGR